MRFIEGEEVLVWHSSTKDYVKAEVLSVKGDKYKVQLKNGIELTASETEMRSNRPSRITTRMSTRNMSKSPSRSSGRRATAKRSPTTSYGKSPRRTSGKSPIRSQARSPARAKKPRGKPTGRSGSSSPDKGSSISPVGRKTLRGTKFAQISLPRIDLSTEQFLDEKKTSHGIDSVAAVTAGATPLMSRLRDSVISPRRTLRSSASISRTESDQMSDVLPRSIDRAVSLPIERKNVSHDIPPEPRERGFSIHKDHIGGAENDGQSEPEPNEKWKKEIRMVNQPQEWGGWFGTLVLSFILPACLILPQLVCTRVQCKSALRNTTMLTHVQDYITTDALLSYTGFLALLSVVSLIPIGKNIEGQYSKTGTLKYRINGFLCALVCLIIYGLCEYKGIAITNFILNNFVQLSISGWIVGTILALMLHIKGIKGPVANLNLHASTNSAIYNFWQGKEINPRIGRLDFKMVLIRASVIGTLVANVAILTKAVSILGTSNLTFAVYLITSLQLLCAVDFLLFEPTILTSFKVLYEGTGYMTCIGHLLYPFLGTLTARFALHQKTRISYLSGIFVLCFFIGYALYRRSNSQKNNFRRNPLMSSLTYPKTIPTSRGKRLIAYGLWGYVRHPNYLGDILMQWSIALITLTSDILPYYAALCCTLVLMHRSLRDGERCKTRYGPAWDQYCSRVKYRIFKRVF